MQISHEHIMAELARVNARLEKGGERFNEILSSQTKLETQMGSVLNGLESFGQRITALEASENIRKGERSVWAGILSSRAFAWIAAAFTALAAVFSNHGAEGIK